MSRYYTNPNNYNNNNNNNNYHLRHSTNSTSHYQQYSNNSNGGNNNYYNNNSNGNNSNPSNSNNEAMAKYSYGLMNVQNKQLLHLSTMSISTDIDDFIAEVTIKQRFINKEIYPVDTRFTFPTPNGGTVFFFEAEVDSKKVSTVVREKDPQTGPEEEEHVGNSVEDKETNLFFVNLGTVNPDKEVVVTLKYVTELALDIDGERMRFVVPARVTPPQRQEEPRAYSYQRNQTSASYKLDMVVTMNMPYNIAEIECTQPIIFCCTEHQKSGKQAMLRLGSRVTSLKYDFALLIKLEKTKVDRARIELPNEFSSEAAAMIVFHNVVSTEEKDSSDRWTKQTQLNFESNNMEVLKVTPDLLKITRGTVIVVYCLLPANFANGTVTLTSKSADGQTTSFPVAIDQDSPKSEGHVIHRLHARSYIKDLDRIISVSSPAISPSFKLDEAQKEITKLTVNYSLTSRYTQMIVSEERFTNGGGEVRLIPQPSRKWVDTTERQLAYSVDRLAVTDREPYHHNQPYQMRSKFSSPLHRSSESVSNRDYSYPSGGGGGHQNWERNDNKWGTGKPEYDEELYNGRRNYSERRSELRSSSGGYSATPSFERKSRATNNNYYQSPQTQHWSGSSTVKVAPLKLEEDLPAIASLQQPDGSWSLSRRLEQYIPEVMIPIERVNDPEIQRLYMLAPDIDFQIWITLVVVSFLDVFGERSMVAVSVAQGKALGWLDEMMSENHLNLTDWLEPITCWLKENRVGVIGK